MVLGLDIAHGVIIPSAKQSAVFVVADIEALPFANTTFDVVIALHCLSHLTDLHRGISEIRRVLAPDGICIISANALASYPHVAAYRRKAWKYLGWNDSFFTTEIFSAETMAAALSTTFKSVAVRNLEGELRIPRNVFVEYFGLNVCTWSRTPTDVQLHELMGMVEIWVAQDAISGFIIEPKCVGLAICRGYHDE
jgi:SAM-dependent methyltransferase